MKLNRVGKITLDLGPIRNDDGSDLRHVLFLRVGPNGRVRNEVEAAGVGNVGRGREQLEGGLLLRVSDVDRDLSGTKVLQGRSRLVGILDPLNSLVLTSLPRGSGNRSSGLDSARG